MLIGHGTFDGADYKINLPGPDMTAIELATLLDRMPAKRQLVVNMTSASGGERGRKKRRPHRHLGDETGTEEKRAISRDDIGPNRWPIQPPTPTRTTRRDRRPP